MPDCRYMEEIGFTAMLVAKKSAGSAPEMNPGEHVTHTSPPNAKKHVHFGCQPNQQSKTSVAPTKKTYVLQIIFFKISQIQSNLRCGSRFWSRGGVQLLTLKVADVVELALEAFGFLMPKYTFSHILEALFL